MSIPFWVLVETLTHFFKERRLSYVDIGQTPFLVLTLTRHRSRKVEKLKTQTFNFLLLFTFNLEKEGYWCLSHTP